MTFLLELSFLVHVLFHDKDLIFEVISLIFHRRDDGRSFLRWISIQSKIFIVWYWQRVVSLRFGSIRGNL